MDENSPENYYNKNKHDGEASQEAESYLESVKYGQYGVIIIFLTFFSSPLQKPSLGFLLFIAWCNNCMTLISHIIQL